MTLLLLLGTVLAFATLVLLIAFFATGGKNQRLRYLAGGFGLATGLVWLIKTFMR